MIVYDTSSSQFSRAGIMVQADPHAIVNDFLNVKQGDILFISGIINEVPALDMNSTTILKGLTAKVISSAHPIDAPVPVFLSDFYNGSYPTGIVKYSTGEQYEGMYVELHNREVVKQSGGHERTDQSSSVSAFCASDWASYVDPDDVCFHSS